MAGLAPKAQKTLRPGAHRFSRPEARRLRKQGVSDREIAKKLGVTGKTIGRALGPREKQPDPPKPRNASERREAAIAALHKALEKEPRSKEN